MFELSPRQIHLDFHTSEAIENVAENFDAEEFAKTVSDAHISSMTVFARCHHGWLYYPSKKFPHLVHPNLKNKNLLFEQVRALHKKGVRAPVYITVQWDYQSAQNHPEWLIRKEDGSHEGASFTEAGFYQSLCVNTGYYEFLKEQTIEVCEMLKGELDGIFFDIVNYRPCLCAACRREMKKLKIDMHDEAEVKKFSVMVLDRFKNNMTDVVKRYSPESSVFYNSGHVGPCLFGSTDAYTHFELESLPSGGWGYLHFPTSARYARTLGKDCMGMTGKFHTSWGDFHSLKNKAALEFECFKMLSMGFASSIGDQLEPNGRLNRAAYKLIGEVYGQCEEREEFARPSKPISQVAVITSETPEKSGITESMLGASQMFEELCVQFDILDMYHDLDKYELVVLCDGLRCSSEFQQKIDEYVKNGGKVIAMCDSGLNDNNEYPKCFNAKFNGMRKEYPDFIVAKGELCSGLEEENEYVIYEQGADFTSDAKAVLYANKPYFVRNGEHFCSHRYTPSSKQGGYPVAVRNGNILLFSHPLFKQYRECAPRWIKIIMKNALDMMTGGLIVSHNGPSHIQISVLKQEEKKRITLHVLSYIPVRKSAQIDIIEERTPVYDLKINLNLPYDFKKAYLAPSGKELNIENGSVCIDKVDGYEIVVLEY